MRLPYDKSFYNLRIVGLVPELCHVATGELVRIYFQLSEPPPLGWAYIFTTLWRSIPCQTRRQIGVERDTIWIDCIPDEVVKSQLSQLEYAVEQASAIYREAAKEQAHKEKLQTQTNSELYSKLETLSRALYPKPPLQENPRFTKWFRFFRRDRKQQPPATERRGFVLEPQDDVRDYRHSHFDGVSLAPDGGSLWLDYFDRDPGGTRFCFRYVLSADAPPRLISGYTHEDSRLNYEIPLERVPRHVFRQAQTWLTSQLEVYHDQPNHNSLSKLLEYVKKYAA
jgi:hypothetical protein